MTDKQIVQDSKYFPLDDILESQPSMEDIASKFNECAKEYTDNPIYFNVRMGVEMDYDYNVYKVLADRYETDEEYNQRVKRIEFTANKKKERDLKQFKELKEKYKNDPTFS